MPEKRTEKKFINYHVKLRSLLSDKQLEDFKSMSNSEKISFIVELGDRPPYPIRVEKNRGKSLEEARMLKEQGNTHFQNENYAKAFAFYSQSILKSSQSMSEFAEELPIFYANRSAALYHLKKYELSINDVNFSLKIGYPLKLKYKLLDRKARCSLALGKHNVACDAFKRTITALDDAELSIERRQKWQKDIQIMLAMMNKNSRRTAINEKNQGTTMKGKRNTKYEAITSAVTIESSEVLGRYGVAKRNIKAGDVIVIEDAHCAVLLKEYMNTNCYCCFKRVEALHACPTCDQVIFCSTECAGTALSTYHGTECSILTTLWESEISVTCLMALRIITQKKLNYFLDKRAIIADLKSNEPAKFDSSMYESVHNLLTHENRRKSEDLLNRAHMAIFLLDCLRRTSYFGGVDSTNNTNELGTLSDHEIYVAELMLHHLQVLQFNAHEVSEVQVLSDQVEAASSEFIGGALYPTLALFNHSCNPSVTRYFEGTRVISVAIQNIKAGDMVGENYGPLFTETAKSDRKRLMNEQYWFTCTCEACELDWPTVEQMKNLEDIKLRCTNKKCGRAININPNADNFLVKCGSCSQSINMFKPLKALQETDGKFAMAKSFLKINKTKRALEEFLKLLNLLDENLVPPYKDYYLCLQALRTCFLLMGNVYTAKCQ